MKKLIPIVLVLVLTLSLFTGCRSRQDDMNSTTDTTVMPDMLPDANDRIDPTNGANKDTAPATTAPSTVPDTVPDTMPDIVPDTIPGTEGRSRRHN